MRAHAHAHAHAAHVYTSHNTMHHSEKLHHCTLAEPFSAAFLKACRCGCQLRIAVKDALCVRAKYPHMPSHAAQQLDERPHFVLTKPRVVDKLVECHNAAVRESRLEKAQHKTGRRVDIAVNVQEGHLLLWRQGGKKGWQRVVEPPHMPTHAIIVEWRLAMKVERSLITKPLPTPPRARQALERVKGVHGGRSLIHI